MEDYPPDYVEHNIPLVLLSGLGIDDETESRLSKASAKRDNGTRLAAASPECHNVRTGSILQRFLAWDGTKQPWNAVALPSSPGTLKYNFLPIGRSYMMPPRKAAPLPQSPTSEGIPTKQSNNELHSPLSPLSPGSPVFPDGIMTPLWFSKHAHQIPALIICFFDFTVDGGAEQDDAIKSDINAIRTALARSGFRTKFAAVLIADQSIVQAPQLEERMAGIRRSATLDVKTGLFFMPPMPSDGEVATFVQTTLMTLQPAVVDYYRELTKHARRKKSRSSVPSGGSIPSRGAAQTLSTPGWNARYEIKQAVFAEFRQEMDVAERHYSQALDDLCDTEGVFETTPSWSPRWNETRLLCDCLAARIIRCHLWNGLTTTAAVSWFDYKARMKSIIDNKGRGTDAYGWLAWESRWAVIMSQLITFAELPILDSVPKPKNEPPLDMNEFHAYSRLDRAYQSVERVTPFYHLHHPGYWLRLALHHARARHASALSIPDEDRVPPGQSPASSVAQRAQTYDTYLVPEPHEEYASAEANTYMDDLQLAFITEQAGEAFLNKDQRRMAEHVRLDLAQDFVDAGLHDRAMEILVPLWDASTWRDENWAKLFARLLALLNRSATALKNAEIALATAWELMSVDGVTPEDVDNSIVESLDGIELPGDAKVAMSFHNLERLSPLAVGFTFDADDAYAGEPVKCQLVLECFGRFGIHPIGVTEVKLAFDSSTVVLHHSAGPEDAAEIEMLSLQDSSEELSAHTDLHLKPGARRVFDFDITFREARTSNLKEVTIRIEGERYRISQTIDDPTMLQSPSIKVKTNAGISEQISRRLDSTELLVLPKPPKVDILFVDKREQYFVGEPVQLSIRLLNNEVQAVAGTLTHQLSSDMDESIDAELRKSDGSDNLSVEELQAGDATGFVLSIAATQVTQRLSVALHFEYQLEQDSDTLLKKTVELELVLQDLIDAKWSFGPLLDTKPWPSYFDPALEETLEKPAGIRQHWQAGLAAQLRCKNAVVVHELAMQIQQDRNDAICHAEPSITNDEVLGGGAKFERSFQLFTQKIAADDRRPLGIHPLCSITWSHDKTTERFTSQIQVPRIALGTSEPRVLCTIEQTPNGPADAVLRYALENLSIHFLTFAITMQASEDFAFTGAKYRNLSLAPLSRVFIDYGILLHDRDGAVYSGSNGRWIQPSLQVLDSYYQKTLRVQAAGPGVKLDSKGNLSVWLERSEIKS